MGKDQAMLNAMTEERWSGAARWSGSVILVECKLKGDGILLFQVGVARGADKGSDKEHVSFSLAVLKYCAAMDIA
jgi:hypothetical protein